MLDVVVVVEMRARNTINKRIRNDGGHETKTIELVKVNEEAYDGGRWTKNMLDDEQMMLEADSKQERREGILEKGGKWG